MALHDVIAPSATRSEPGRRIDIPCRIWFKRLRIVNAASGVFWPISQLGIQEVGMYASHTADSRVTSVRGMR